MHHTLSSHRINGSRDIATELLAIAHILRPSFYELRQEVAFDVGRRRENTECPADDYRSKGVTGCEVGAARSLQEIELPVSSLRRRAWIIYFNRQVGRAQ